jgi:hypothetical protein
VAGDQHFADSQIGNVKGRFAGDREVQVHEFITTFGSHRIVDRLSDTEYFEYRELEESGLAHIQMSIEGRAWNVDLVLDGVCISDF